VLAVDLAPHPISANDGQSPTRGARLQLLVSRAHTQVPAEGRGHDGFESFAFVGIGGGIGGHSL
jgi:hypothetical protein